MTTDPSTTPNPPETPAAPSPSYARESAYGVRHALGLLLIALLVVGAIVGVAVFAVQAASRALAVEMQQLRDDNDKKSNELIDAIKQLPKEIGPLQPPSNDKLFTVVVKGLGVTENVVATGQVGTTPTAAFATDLTTTPFNQQTDAYTQECVFTNRDTTDVLCFKPIPWASAGANCAAKCAAFTITCPATNGAGTTATDGTVTPPGGSWPRRYDGTSCVCVVGSAAGTAYQTERVVRRRPKRKQIVRREFRLSARVQRARMAA